MEAAQVTRTPGFLAESVKTAAAPGDQDGDEKEQHEDAERDADDNWNLVLADGPTANHPGPVERRNHGCSILTTREGAN